MNFIAEISVSEFYRKSLIILILQLHF